MGQTSSQLEGTQVQKDVDVNIGEAESSSTESRELTPQPMASQAPSRKHARAPSASEDAIPVAAKRLKTTATQSAKPKKHTAGRSIPQHVRGINIRPSQDALALREVDPAASQNIQRPSLFGDGRKDAANDTLDEAVAAVSNEDDEDDEGDNITVQHTPAKPIHQKLSPRNKNARQPSPAASTASDSNPSHSSSSEADSNACYSQSDPAKHASDLAVQQQRARQQLAVKRGQEALAQDAAWAEQFAAEEDRNKKKGMLRSFIKKHQLDPILVLMFFPNEKEEDEAEEGAEDDGQQQQEEDESETESESDSESESSESEDEVDSVAESVEETPEAVKDTQNTTTTSTVPANGIPTPSTSSQPHDAPSDDDDEEEEEEEAAVEPVAEITFNDNPTIEDAEHPYHLELPEKARRVSRWLLQDQQEPGDTIEVSSRKGSPEVVVEGKQKKPAQRKKCVARKSAEMIVDGDDEQEGVAEVQVDDGSEIQVTRKKRPVSKRKKSVARKSVARVDGSDDEYEQPAVMGVDDSAEAAPDSEVKLEEAEEKAKDNLRGTVKGTWTLTEIATADEVFNSFCNSHNITSQELCRQIQDWEGELDESFKTQIFEAFPLRAKAAIRGLCQRRWHDNNTGPWSGEEDALLREWHAVHPGNWIEIGCMIGNGRTAASCRDRWKDHLQYEGKLNKGPWTKEEEDELRTCVEKQPAGDEGKRVDWSKVSEDMGCKRAAKRCQLKWKAMQKRQISASEEKMETEVEEQQDEDTMLQNSILAQLQSDDHAAPSAQHQQCGALQPPSKKQKLMESKYKKLGWGDVADALHEIYGVFTETELDILYPHESTFWSTVSLRLNKASNGSKFKALPKLRRRCYLGALERFGDEGIMEWKGMARRAGLLCKRIMDAHDEGELEGLWKLEDRASESVARQRPRHPQVGWLEAGARDPSQAPGSSPPPYPGDHEEQDAEVIPETQLDDEIANGETQQVIRVAAKDNESATSSRNRSSRSAMSSARSTTPVLSLKAFVRKCASGRMRELPKRPSDRAGEDYVEVRSEGGGVYRFEGSREELEGRIRECRGLREGYGRGNRGWNLV